LVKVALLLTSDLAWRIAANIAKPPELVDPASRLGARVLLHTVGAVT
jgi:hypothetical protein